MHFIMLHKVLKINGHFGTLCEHPTTTGQTNASHLFQSSSYSDAESEELDILLQTFFFWIQLNLIQVCLFKIIFLT